MTRTATIHDLARQFDRLSPSQVDTSRSGNGQREAGHKGFERSYYESNGIDQENMETVGWYCVGGSSGNPVMRIHEDDVAAACERLAALPDGAIDTDGIGSLDAILTGLRYSWAY